MKSGLKGFVCGVLVTVGCMGVIVAADSLWTKIDVVQNNMKVVIDGNLLEADNFLYNDTTYLPIRAVSEALGKDVQFDEATSTAYIKRKQEGGNMNNETENPVFAVDGLATMKRGDNKYYIILNDIMRKYPGDYNFKIKEDRTYWIGWREKVFFDNYPQDGSYVELDWYNTVLQPWLAREGWKE